MSASTAAIKLVATSYSCAIVQEHPSAEMADYLVCSYTDDPIFGELIDPEFLRQMGRERSLRNLKKPKDVNQAGEPWGGAFWEIRTTLGQDVRRDTVAQS